MSFFQVVVVSQNFLQQTKISETLNKKKFKGQKRQIMTLQRETIFNLFQKRSLLTKNGQVCKLNIVIHVIICERCLKFISNTFC